MTVTAVRKDPETLTLTIIAEFEATPEAVWQLWADPRRLERWFGPPTYPTTVTTHHLMPGSRILYHMTGPEGDRVGGYLDVIEAQAPNQLVLREGFADADGSPMADPPPNELRVTIEAVGVGRTRMSIGTTFPSSEAMERYLAMGMAEGLTESIERIDAVLAATA